MSAAGNDWDNEPDARARWDDVAVPFPLAFLPWSSAHGWLDQYSTVGEGSRRARRVLSVDEPNPDSRSDLAPRFLVYAYDADGNWMDKDPDNYAGDDLTAAIAAALKPI